jgi:repressor LexA
MNNLKLLRNSLRLTQKEFGDLFNVTQTMVSKWERGENKPTRDTEKKIAEYFNVSIKQVQGLEPIHDLIAQEKNSFKNLMPVSIVSLPLLGEIAAGEPIYMNNEYNIMVEANSEIKADFCLRVKGDSMINAGIRDGAIVFIKEQPMVENGEIACVSIDDEATLKRVYFHPDHIILQAENPKYAPIIIFPKDNRQIRILGKAISYQDIVR